MAERRLIMKMEDGVRDRDLAQLEKTARELKGKPGLGPIRKTIKKHIKKLQVRPIVSQAWRPGF